MEENQVNEIDVVMDQLTADIGRISREKAIAVAKLATAESAVRRQQGEIEDLRAKLEKKPEPAEKKSSAT